MKISDLNTDTAILAELGQRIARARIDRQMTQAHLANAAGVSKSTVERLENGASVQLTNPIRKPGSDHRLSQSLTRLKPATSAASQ